VELELVELESVELELVELALAIQRPFNPKPIKLNTQYNTQYKGAVAIATAPSISWQSLNQLSHSSPKPG
ncbi:hypothetical protein, partial [Limnothrix sp. PR1529]|uniref:hypothetical protein n=1 Tax=Limnothrix sp. PR1529 TaxID=1704291 RepID=UPI001F1AD51D